MFPYLKSLHVPLRHTDFTGFVRQMVWLENPKICALAKITTYSLTLYIATDFTRFCLSNGKRRAAYSMKLKNQKFTNKLKSLLSTMELK